MQVRPEITQSNSKYLNVLHFQPGLVCWLFVLVYFYLLELKRVV